MNLQITNSIRENFYNWLKNNNPSYSFQMGRWYYHCVRFKRDEHFDLIFCQENYDDPQPDSDKIRINEPMEYSGIYCSDTDQLYDVRFELSTALDLYGDNCPRFSEIKKQMKLLIEKQLHTMLHDSDRLMKESQLTEQSYISRLQNYRQQAAAYEAKEIFLNADDPYLDPVDELPYSYMDDISDESVFEFILNPENIIRECAEAYCNTHQEAFTYEYLKRSLIKAAYEKILANPDDTAHAMRKIRKAIMSSAAKSLQVTIRDLSGNLLTLSTSANSLLRDIDGQYLTDAMSKRDKKEFEAHFGEFCNRYSVTDIVSITYRRKVLYEAAS